jgi:hypothetical protein
MAWPTPQDYNEAIQNPRSAFTDPDLGNGQPELNPLGLPRAIAGNFACVYKIQTSGQRWAARCFSREVSDQQRRYEVISTYLTKTALPYTVQFTYMPTGIKVLGKTYPLLKMEWVQGESLTAFVGRSIGYPDTLLSLAKVWVRMMADLKAVSIAHGDLQHGNVVVVGDHLRLIDYDGMFVPGLAGKQSNECGHRNYQLPSRTGYDFGPYLDNFSAWVIYVSLLALAVHPELWNNYRGGDECLIFRKEDFVQPENSALLRDLNSSPNIQLRFLVELFSSLFNLSPQDIPSLDGNLPKIIVEPPRPWWIDHAENPAPREETPTEVKRTEEAEASAPDPGWIVDSLTDVKPIKQLAFQGNIKEVRIVVLGSLALAILTNLLTEIPASELFVVFSCVFGLNLLFCYIRYERDPSQAEFETFKKEFKVFIGKLGEHQAVMDTISVERTDIQAKLAESEREITAKKSRLSLGLQTDLNSAQLELNSQLQGIAQRRRDISTSETNKLNSLQGTLGNQVSELDRKISGLKQQEVNEANSALNTLQSAHVKNHLRSHSVMNSWIPGIGETYKSRLHYSGFQTAADIDNSVLRVNGIGATRKASLILWRQGLEHEARMSAPNLSSQERLAIENKYRQTRQMHESEKQRLQAQLNDYIASARQHFAGARQFINQEEQQFRTVCAQKKVAIQQEHDAKVVLLDKEAVATRNQATPKLSELSQKLQNAQKQIFALKWQKAKREKEGRRFASLRFRNYLQSIISS